ncbi:hypothetical protein QQM39_28405 [Streptomyces sp. DT2A-34]|uniref:hypothetical protein n=1 Tax=Streptomyces sp. DT2A-34 TaxID=3051182 RepID=UPI00265C47A3|nr:hypothetical protein [Streptomyces sp. DT2A-34]MDO0914614.1 hypothetical protein [Streptomyces sp. DT2A-34]
MSAPLPLTDVPIPGYARRCVGRVLVPMVSVGIFSWAPFAWTAVRQRSFADAVLAAIFFVAVIGTMAYGYSGGNGVAIWVVLVMLMLGGSVLAGIRTPRTENVRTGGKPAAVWLVASLTVVYLVTAGALAPGESPDHDETTPPPVSPAPSLSPELEPTAAVTESVAPPDVPETEEAEESDAPETGEEEEAEADDNGRTSGQDFDGQASIQFGYACSPVGALGIAEDGRPAKCFMGKDGRARWGYDSNRG